MDLKNRSEKGGGRGQIFTLFKPMVVPLAQDSGETHTGQIILQPISYRSNKLPTHDNALAREVARKR